MQLFKAFDLELEPCLPVVIRADLAPVIGWLGVLGGRIQWHSGQTFWKSTKGLFLQKSLSGVFTHLNMVSKWCCKTTTNGQKLSQLEDTNTAV